MQLAKEQALIDIHSCLVLSCFEVESKGKEASIQGKEKRKKKKKKENGNSVIAEKD